MSNVPFKDVCTLKLKMAHKKVHGGEIDVFTQKLSGKSGGSTKVNIVYKDEKGINFLRF